jgi:hypothetical protein
MADTIRIIEHDGKKIIIKKVFPPIPTRKYDCRAFVDGDEEARRYGYGETPEAAIQDFMDTWGVDE